MSTTVHLRTDRKEQTQIHGADGVRARRRPERRSGVEGRVPREDHGFEVEVRVRVAGRAEGGAGGTCQD